MLIKNTEVFGFEKSVYRSGYPYKLGEPIDFEVYGTMPIMNSSFIDIMNNIFFTEKEFLKSNIDLEKKDYDRSENLANVPNGSGHDNYLKGIIIQFDLQYPQYFTPQLQRYSFVDIISSQSKMHSITKSKDITDYCNTYVDKEIIKRINLYIKKYDESNESDKKKHYFMKIISNLPMGYELWMGISTNYLQLKTIYSQRKNHKLPEWRYFCDWIKKLPNSYLITLNK